MKHLPIILIVILLTGCAGLEKRTDCKISFMGIQAEHFEGREIAPILAGVAGSLLTHEVLGHLLFAELNGGGHFNWDRRIVIMEDYHNQSHSTQQMFHRAGFLSQLLVGGILTAIPATRHADFTLGFNAFTTINTGIYTISGGLGETNCSDIKQLDHGTAEGIAYTVGAGALTYINLKKPISPTE